MTKICDMKSEIVHLEIAIDEAISIQVFNTLNFFLRSSLVSWATQLGKKKNFPHLKVLPNL